MTDEQPPPPLRLMSYITGHWVAAAVYAAARLKLADQFRSGPRHSDVVAAAIGANPSACYRLLRALTTLGIFEETGPRTYRLTDVGELLREDNPHSLRAMALFQGAAPHWLGWGNFLHAVQTGESAFEKVHGQPFFDYCQTDAEFSAAFNGAMTGMSAMAAEAVVGAYDFSGIQRLVDVGGGHGYLLSRILQANPGLRGCVYDLPHVVAGAQAVINAAGVADRCETVGGSFFETVPPADAYISKNIIHDWDDEHSRTILRHMKANLAAGGRVLLVEIVITGENRHALGTLLDLEMLHSTHGGRERTTDEYAALFTAVGLKLRRVVPTNSLFSIVEATA